MKKGLLGLILAILMIFPFVMKASGEEAKPETKPDGKAEEKPAEAPAPPRGLLMAILDKAGLAGPLDKAGINIYGYVEYGYMYDATSPRANSGPTFIGYNSFKNQGNLDNISLNIERTIDPSKKQFDIGFRLEGIYGSDAAFLHSNGLFDTQTGRNQGDLLQAMLGITLPGVPVGIRAGKWIELGGFEQVSANIYGAFGDPARGLYTHSYQFLYAEPVTQTGVLATYVLNPKWTFDAGFTRGWNQSLRSGNNAADFLGRVTFTPSDKTQIIFVMTEGPEFPITFGRNQPKGDGTHWWTWLDLVVTHKVTDKLSLGVGIDYVYTQSVPGLTGAGPKQWGGVVGYASYALDSHFTLNGRVEWFKDAANGYPTGASVSANYYEATVGIAIKPFPNDRFLSKLLFRPEVRYDLADQSIFNNGDKNQLTFSVDALFMF